MKKWSRKRGKDHQNKVRCKKEKKKVKKKERTSDNNLTSTKHHTISSSRLQVRSIYIYFVWFSPSKILPDSKAMNKKISQPISPSETTQISKS